MGSGKCRPLPTLQNLSPAHLPHHSPLFTMQPSSDDIADDSDNSTTTTASTAFHIKHSSGSEVAPMGDPCWQAIRRAQASGGGGDLALDDLRFLRRVGSGDMGSVYLVELKCAEGCMFAAKVMDKKEVASRFKESRGRTEREILELLDHPFLPTLYAALESPRWSCLLTEFCPGGDLHVLRQRQPHKRFHEADVRFYASEVIVALEYLHMMGIIYRDLKPENVLVRSDGHIMLTDFDLSLKSENFISTAQIVSDEKPNPKEAPPFGTSSCILPSCIVPTVSCFHPIRRRRKRRGLEIVAEPVEVRSMSFVGTHEYLAPEMVSGEGHGNAVDWWTLGILIFELLYGRTPFKGTENELTLANIVGRALEFPREPWVAAPAKDLIAHLLVKQPSRRMGSTLGATAIKHHAFFNGVSWALLRCASPPYVPRPCNHVASPYACTDTSTEYY